MTTGKIKIVLKIPINLRQHLSNDFKRFYPIQYFSSPILTPFPPRNAKSHLFNYFIILKIVMKNSVILKQVTGSFKFKKI